jgi:hypothetical protein
MICPLCGCERKTCSVPGCKRKHMALGFCNAHYQRFKRIGNVKTDKPLGEKSGTHNPRWKGGEFISEGRVFVYAPTHPFPNRNKTYVLRYRLAMEAHLGRYLDPSEIVHHINGNMMDDRIENLQVMTNTEHMRLHGKQRAGLNNKK